MNLRLAAQEHQEWDQQARINMEVSTIRITGKIRARQGENRIVLRLTENQHD